MHFQSWSGTSEKQCRKNIASINREYGRSIKQKKKVVVIAAATTTMHFNGYCECGRGGVS